MTVKIGINGFGRIGRLAFRRIMDLGEKSSDIRSCCNQRLDYSSTFSFNLLKYVLQLMVLSTTKFQST